MGEWSEYFEDFPEEDQANYDERGRLRLTPLQESLRRKLPLRENEDNSEPEAEGPVSAK